MVVEAVETGGWVVEVEAVWAVAGRVVEREEREAREAREAAREVA